LLPLDKPPATLASIGGCGKVIKPVNELLCQRMNPSLLIAINCDSKAATLNQLPVATISHCLKSLRLLLLR
jgi:hypothetical protein